jgi:hypothetical protein
MIMKIGMMNESILKEAYSRLRALKDNLPNTYESDQTYVQEFHNILDILQKESGHNLGSFRVPESEMKRQSSGGNYISGEVYYTGRMVCPRTYLMMRIDGILNFFAISSPKTKIGFSPS